MTTTPQTPQQFFSENMKWIALVLFCILMMKAISSCNHNMNDRSKDKVTTHLIDSLQKNIVNLKDSVKSYETENRILGIKAESEKSKADAVRSVAEKVKSNTTTTVNVRGAEIDTTKVK